MIYMETCNILATAIYSKKAKFLKWAYKTYKPIKRYGEEENRTLDPQNANLVLYQLSYFPEGI